MQVHLTFETRISPLMKRMYLDIGMVALKWQYLTKNCDSSQQVSIRDDQNKALGLLSVPPSDEWAHRKILQRSKVKFVNENQSNWDEKLQFAYRTSQ